jgi:hypothetical protein
MNFAQNLGHIDQHVDKSLKALRRVAFTGRMSNSV